MKKRCTEAELAALDLPGRPATRRGWHKLAKRESWPFTWEVGPFGRRRAYLVAGTPRDVQEALAAPGGRAVVPAAPADPRDLKDWQRRVMDARCALVAEVRALAARELLSLGQARAELVRRAAAGALPEHLQAAAARANARRDGLSAASLARWQVRLERSGPVALAPRPARAERGVPPAWLADFLRLYARPGKPSAALCYETLARERPDLDLPCLGSVHRELRRLGALGRNRGRIGPRELKALRPYVARDTSDLDPADGYIADGHTADIEALHPRTGRPFRPEIISVLDLATRRCVGFAAGEAESAWLVGDALRPACALAIPALLYVDRGRGFRNRHLGDEATGVLARLGVTVTHSLPYNSQARGVVERFHQSCWVAGARLLPGFVGADMDREARQRVFKRSRREVAERGATRALMAWAAFLGWARAQADAYNARPHSALPKVRDAATGRLRHQSPDEAWAAAESAGFEPVRAEAGELDGLFRPEEVRQVARGSVKVQGLTYFARELEPLHGEEVRVAYDTADPSRVWVRALDGRHLAVAALDANRAPYFPQPAVERARERRGEARLKRVGDKAAAIRDEMGRGRLIEARPEPSPVTAEEAARHAAWVADIEAERAKRVGEQHDPTLVRFKRALGIEAALDAGQGVDPEDARWLGAYQTTAEYRAQRRLYDDFTDHYNDLLADIA